MTGQVLGAEMSFWSRMLGIQMLLEPVHAVKRPFREGLRWRAKFAN